MANFQQTDTHQFIQDLVDALNNSSFGGNNNGSGNSNKNTAKGKYSGGNKRGGVLENFTKTINNLSNATRSLLGVSKSLLAPWAEVDQAAANFSKNIGLSAKGLENLRKTTIRFVKEGNLGALFDVSAQELIKLQEDYAKAVGRNVSMGRKAVEYLAASTKIEGSTEMMTKMENFGISMEEAGKRVGKVFSDSSKKGLAWAKTVKNINDNFKLAQNYTFSKGLNSFYKMAEKAAAINLDMNQAASFADKVNTIEGAITTGASLQVLGGPFAQFSNPLEMMYEGLNGMDELQDRIIKMFGSLGSFNKLTGEVEIGSFDKMRIREAAKATGMDYSNIMEMIQKNARRDEIERQLTGNPNNLSKQTLELIKNVGLIKEGQAGVYDKEGNFINARNINETKARELEQLYASESEDIKDIVVNLRGVKDILSGTDKQIKNKFAEKGEEWGVGQGIKNIFDNISKSNTWLSIIAGAQAVGVVSGGLRGVGNIRDRVKPNIISKNGKWFLNESGKWESVGGGKFLSGQAATNATKGAGRLKVGLTKAGLKVAKGANIAGWVGLGGEILTDSLINNGKMKKGGFSDYAGHIGSQALGYGALGAQIGSFIGGPAAPITTAVGAALGAILGTITGTVKATKNKRERELSEHGVNLTGRYKNRELKEIRDAINGNGQISEKLQMKLEEQGDTAAIERLQEIKNNIFKVQVVDAGKHAFGGIITGPGSGTSDSIPALLSNGESVMTARATKMFGPELSIMNRLGGGTGNFGKIRPNVLGLNRGMIDVKAPLPGSIVPNAGGNIGSININFSPIKIEFPNGTNKDITNDLLSNPVFVRDLTRKIEEGLIRSGNGGHLVVHQGNKYI